MCVRICIRSPCGQSSAVKIYLLEKVGRCYNDSPRSFKYALSIASIAIVGRRDTHRRHAERRSAIDPVTRHPLCLDEKITRDAVENIGSDLTTSCTPRSVVHDEI